MEFSKTTPVLIYGAGEIGKSVAFNLIHSGYQVLAFLDKHKGRGETMIEKPVYMFGAESVDVDKSKCVIVICLSDGLQHKSVAVELWKEGYQYIICLPMNFAVSFKKRVDLSIRYNLILDGQFSKIKKVESFGIYLKAQLNCMDSVIRRFGDNYIAWVREEILFTECLQMWTGDKSKVFTTPDNQNINITVFDGYRELFQYLQGESNGCEGYWKSSALEKTQQEKCAMIEKREELLRTYEREYGLGLEFFIAAAPQTIWNERGYWNLQGGHHRMIFLQQRGHVLFPIRVRKNEFDVWCNRDKLKEVKKYISSHNKNKTMVPIPHPAFLNFEAERELQGNTILSEVLRFLRGRMDLRYSVLDYSDMDGYFARNFSRILDGKVIYAGGEEIGFVRLLNELLHVPQVVCLERDKAAVKNAYSLVFIINRSDLDFGEKELQAQLDETVENFLFIEMPTEELEKVDSFIHNTSFQSYRALHREVYRGKMREVGVLLK